MTAKALCDYTSTEPNQDPEGVRKLIKYCREVSRFFAVFFVIFIIMICNLTGCSPSSEETKKIKAADTGEPGKILPPVDGQKSGLNAILQPQGAPAPDAKSVATTPLTPASIIAQVDNVTFTKGQLDAEVKKSLSALSDNIPPDRLAEAKQKIRRQIVDDFIVRTLLVKEVNRLKITANDQEIHAAINDLRASLPANVTMDDMLKKRGLTMERLRQEVSLGIRINKLVASQPVAKVKPTDKEITAFYKSNRDKFKMPEMVHARHILIAKTAGEDAAARAKKKEKAEFLRKQLIDGADFAETAKAHSDCPSKNNGGDLGSFPKGQMVKPFDEAAFKQKKNEIGPVVQTDFGYHIIQVLDHTKAKTQPLDKPVKEKISAFLVQQKRYGAFNDLMNQLKSKANIVVADKIE